MRTGGLRLTFLNGHRRHGGTERCLNDLCQGLQQRGQQVTVVLGRGEKKAASEPFQVLGPGTLEWVWQRGWHRLIGLTDTLLMSPLWRAVGHRAFRQADIIHIHNVHGGFFNLWALPLLVRHCPLVISLHDMYLLTGDCLYSGSCQRFQTTCGACPIFRRPYRQRGALGGGDLTRLNLAIKRTACGLIDPRRLTLVAPSQWLARLTAKSHLKAFPIQVIPYGIDLTFFSPLEQTFARKRLGLPQHTLLLAAVAGNWDNPYKGGDQLLELAGQLRQHQLAHIVAVGRMSPALRLQFQSQGVIPWEGLHGPEVIRDVFSACDAALVLSKEDNLPYVVLEALACGCPPLACASGGIPEMFVDEQHGWLLPPAAPVPEFLACLRRLQAENGERRQQRRQAARHWAEQHYGLSTMLDAYQRVYAGLVNYQQRAA